MARAGRPVPLRRGQLAVGDGRAVRRPSGGPSTARVAGSSGGRSSGTSKSLPLAGEVLAQLAERPAGRARPARSRRRAAPAASRAPAARRARPAPRGPRPGVVPVDGQHGQARAAGHGTSGSTSSVGSATCDVPAAGSPRRSGRRPAGRPRPRRRAAPAPRCRTGSACRNGQRVWNRQPEGGSAGLGRSPRSRIRSRRSSTSGSGMGIADISAIVYGCSGCGVEVVARRPARRAGRGTSRRWRR